MLTPGEFMTYSKADRIDALKHVADNLGLAVNQETQFECLVGSFKCLYKFNKINNAIEPIISHSWNIDAITNIINRFYKYLIYIDDPKGCETEAVKVLFNATIESGVDHGKYNNDLVISAEAAFTISDIWNAFKLVDDNVIENEVNDYLEDKCCVTLK